MHRCTGKCCQRLWISASREQLRRFIDIERNVEAARIWTVLRDDGEWEDGSPAYRCSALTQAGCVLNRADRPDMCNDYPYAGGKVCGCGARSDAEARGVALMRIEAV